MLHFLKEILDKNFDNVNSGRGLLQRLYDHHKIMEGFSFLDIIGLQNLAENRAQSDLGITVDNQRCTKLTLVSFYLFFTCAFKSFVPNLNIILTLYHPKCENSANINVDNLG